MPDRTQADYGLQSVLRIFSTPAGQEALIDKPLLGQTLTVAGTYTCRVDTSGVTDVEAHLKASAVTGTVTPSFISTLADKATQKAVSAPAGVALVANTQQDLVLTALRGLRNCLVSIVVAAASSATFSVAEVNGK